MILKKNVTSPKSKLRKDFKKITSTIWWKGFKNISICNIIDMLDYNHLRHFFAFKIILILFFLLFSNLTYADTKKDLGIEVYNNKAQCGICHMLQAAGSSGNIGPNLDQLKPTIDQVINAVTNGVGVMQAWEGILTYEEIEAVAYYVFNSTNR